MKSAWSMAGPFLAALLVLGTAGVTTPAAPGGSAPERSPAWSVDSGQTSATLRLVVAAQGNEARYRVREQLAGIDFPSDAVGTTAAVTGGLALADDGSVVKEGSKFVVDLTTLKSDSDRRDGYIQRRTLQTDQFPVAEFVPTAARGLPSPLPSTGELTFQLAGDLTVHGVTKAVTWTVTARASSGGYTGAAHTAFTFADFGMTIPRVASVLSVQDTIRLEYEFNLLVQR